MAIAEPNKVLATMNYLVPLDGTTHVVATPLTAVLTGTEINWKNFTNNNFPFNPQGAYLDNTAGLADLVITIATIDFPITMKKGAAGWVSFPAPVDARMTIVGNGVVLIYWVDYPVIPNYTVPPVTAVAVEPVNAAFTRSYATPAAASGVLIAANLNRKYLSVVNNDPVETIYISPINPATGIDIPLIPGASWEPAIPPSNAIYFIAAAAGVANSVVILEGV